MTATAAMPGDWRRLLPPAAAAGCGILVGAAMVATRFVIDQTEPASLALLRYAIGVLCLLPPALLSARARFAARDLAPIALLGIGQFGILVALLNYGLQFTSSAMGALIFATLPLLTMVLAAGLGQERLTLPKALGVALTVVGVALALGGRLGLDGGGTGGWRGELAVLGSALCGAVCSVFYRPYLAKYPALPVSLLAMFASVLFLAVPAGWEGFFTAVPRFTTAGWLAVLFIGANSGLGYYLWLWALQHAPATNTAVFLALSPITALGLGAALLDEAVTAPFVAGLAAVAIGIWLAHRRPGAAISG